MSSKLRPLGPFCKWESASESQVGLSQLPGGLAAELGAFAGASALGRALAGQRFGFWGGGEAAAAA